VERQIETLLLATRWLLLPLYLALIASMLALFVTVARELVHLATAVWAMDDVDLVLALLSILDLVLVANLIVMVAVSSYESYIARIDAGAASRRPEWLGKLDSGDVKLKVGLSIVMISAIHLLRAYLADEPRPQMLLLAGTHMVFVLSVLGVALVERLAHGPHGE
jgi:uncharacterized protein (TIGR00645 family)